jgi:hypothetical protein
MESNSSPFRLVWTAPDGKLAQAYFETWEKLEAFSAKCVAMGLNPWVPLDVPTPYGQRLTLEGNDGVATHTATAGDGARH